MLQAEMLRESEVSKIIEGAVNTPRYLSQQNCTIQICGLGLFKQVKHILTERMEVFWGCAIIINILSMTAHGTPEQISNIKPPRLAPFGEFLSFGVKR